MILLDAHNHLQDDALAPRREAIMRDLEASGITRAVVNGTTERDWEAVATLARQHPWVLPSYGLHPWRLAHRTPKWKEHLLAYAEAGNCGIGEIGLDRWMPNPDFETQKEVFLWQLRLAAQLNLPASIHCLKAWGALWDILREEPLPERGFLLHAYSGPSEMVENFARRGAYFSFSGYFLNPGKTARLEPFRTLSADRLLVETDAPSMPLPSERNRYPLPDTAEGRPVNHPANLVAVYEGLAELRGSTQEALSIQVAKNFERLFGRL